MSQEKFFNYAELEFIRANEKVEGSSDQSDSGVANRVPAQLGKNSVWLKERLELLDSPRSIIKLLAPEDLNADLSYIIMSEGEYILPDESSPGSVVNIRASSSNIKVKTNKSFANRTNSISLVKGTTLSVIMNEDGTSWHSIRSDVNGVSYTLDEADKKFCTKEELSSTYSELLKRISEKVNTSDFNNAVEGLELSISARQTKSDADEETKRVNAELGRKQSISSAESESKRVNDELDKKQNVIDASVVEQELRTELGKKADNELVQKRMDEISRVADAAQSRSEARLETARVNSELKKKTDNSDFLARNEIVDQILGTKVDSATYNSEKESLQADINSRQTKSDAELEKSRVNEALSGKVDQTTFNERVSEVNDSLSKKVDTEEYANRVVHVDNELSLKESKADAEKSHEFLLKEIEKKGDNSELELKLGLKADKSEVWNRSESDSRYLIVDRRHGQNPSSQQNWMDIGYFLDTHGSAELMIDLEDEDSHNSLKMVLGKDSAETFVESMLNKNLIKEVRISKPEAPSTRRNVAVLLLGRVRFTITLIGSSEFFELVDPSVSSVEVVNPFKFRIPECSGSYSTSYTTEKLGIGDLDFTINSDGEVTLLDRSSSSPVADFKKDRSRFYYNSKPLLEIDLNGLSVISNTNFSRLKTTEEGSFFETSFNKFNFNKRVESPSLYTESGSYLDETGYVFSKDGKLGLEVGDSKVDFKARSLTLGESDYIISKKEPNVNLIQSKNSTEYCIQVGELKKTQLVMDSTSAKFEVELYDKGNRVFSRSNKVQWNDTDVEGRPQVERGSSSSNGTVKVTLENCGYAGYSISDKASFLANSSIFGLYDEVESAWSISKSGKVTKIYYAGDPVLSTTTGGFEIHDHSSEFRSSFTVQGENVEISSNASSFKFNRRIEAPSLLVSGSSIDGEGVHDNGHRVYSPLNKPTSADTGSVSTEDADKWFLSKDRMNTWVVESGGASSSPDGDWWIVGQIQNECSVKVSIVIEGIRGSLNSVPSRRLDMLVSGKLDLNGTLQCEGDQNSKCDFYVQELGGVTSIYVRLPVLYKCNTTTYCLGEKLDWSPKMERSDFTPDSSKKSNILLDTTDINKAGVYNLWCGGKSISYDSRNKPSPYDLNAARVEGDITKNFNADKLEVRSFRLSDGEFSYLDASISEGSLVNSYHNLNSEFRFESENQFAISFSNGLKSLVIDKSRFLSRIPVVFEEEGVEYLAYSSINELTKKKLRNYESSDFDFNRDKLLFNSKDLMSTDDESLFFNKGGLFKQIVMNRPVVVNTGLELEDLATISNRRGKVILKVQSSGDLNLGAAGGVLRLGASADDKIETSSISIESEVKDKSGKLLLTPTGEVHDKGSRVYSKNNKPTPNEIGAANVKGDVAVDFNAANMKTKTTTSEIVTTNILRLGSIELRQNHDGSLGFYI